MAVVAQGQEDVVITIGARLSKSMEKLKTWNRDIKKSFDASALGIMFFGQAMTRMTSSIEKASRKTFQDIMHSVEGNVTAFDRMDTAMKMVQYRIGSALEPLFNALTPVIKWLSTVVAENEGIFRTLFVTLTSLGTVLAVGGALKLGLSAFTGQLLNLNTLLGTSITKLDALRTIAGVGIIIDAGLNVVDAFLQDGTLTKDSLAKFLIQAGAGAFLINPAVGAALVTIGVGMQLLPGDIAAKFVSILSVMFGAAVTTLAAIAETLISPLIYTINRIIGAYNYITGSNVSKLEYYTGTKAAANRLSDVWGDYKEVFGINQGTSGGSTTNNVNVYGMNTAEVIEYIDSGTNITRFE